MAMVQETYYAFQVAYTVGLAPQVMYLNPDGTFSYVPVWINTTSLTAVALIPNTLFSVSLAAANDAYGTGNTGFGPAAAFTTAASQPIAQSYSAVYSTKSLQIGFQILIVIQLNTIRKFPQILLLFLM